MAFANNEYNFYDTETHEGYWVSGPKRDRTDARYSRQQPIVDEDAREAYEAFLAGAAVPFHPVQQRPGSDHILCANTVGASARRLFDFSDNWLRHDRIGSDKPV